MRTPGKLMMQMWGCASIIQGHRSCINSLRQYAPQRQSTSKQFFIPQTCHSSCLYTKMYNLHHIIPIITPLLYAPNLPQILSSIFFTTFHITFYFSVCLIKPAPQLYYSIIIMLEEPQHPNNFDTNSLPSLPPLSNSTPQTPPSTDSPEQPQKKLNMTRNRKTRMQLEWKKEIKHYFKALKNYRSHNHSQKRQAWLVVALKLLDYSKKAHNPQLSCPNLSKSKIQRKDAINSKIITTINNPPRLHSFLILVLSFRTHETKQQQIYYDLEILSKTSRIIYKKINLRNWQDIHSEIQRAREQTKNLIQILENKSALMVLLQRNPELEQLIQGFHELEVAPLQHPLQPSQKNACNLQQIKDVDSVYQVIDRFQFIRGSLLNSLQRQSYAALDLDQMFAITITYNIITLLPLTTKRQLFPQMRPFLIAISRHLHRQHERQQTRNQSVALNQDHIPVHLENAQNCWRCKMKRGYVGCSTCSRNQGKNIALCLNCYQIHHREINQATIGVSHIERDSSLYQRWAYFDQEVEKLLQESKRPLLAKAEDAE